MTILGAVMMVYLAGYVVALGYERESDPYRSFGEGWTNAIFWPVVLFYRILALVRDSLALFPSKRT